MLESASSHRRQSSRHVCGRGHLFAQGHHGGRGGISVIVPTVCAPDTFAYNSSAKDWPDNRERHAATEGLGSSGDNFSRQAWLARQSRTIVSARSHLGIGIPTCLHRSRLSCQVRAFQGAIRNDRRQVAERAPAPPFAETSSAFRQEKYRETLLQFLRLQFG